jgi:hypothetical protein
MFRLQNEPRLRGAHILLNATSAMNGASGRAPFQNA